MAVCELRLKATSFRLPRTVWTLVEIGSVALMVFANWDVPYYPDWVWQTGGMPLTVWLYNVGCAPVFALIIFVFSLSRGCIAILLEYRPFVLLGEVSFGFYLFHPLALRFAGMFSAPEALKIVVGFGLSICFAYLGWILLETPTIRWAKLLVRARRPVVATSVIETEQRTA